MSRILTREAFENAIVVNGAIGGSTNAVLHLLAIAQRAIAASNSHASRSVRRAPSTSGCPSRSSALAGVTLPP